MDIHGYSGISGYSGYSGISGYSGYSGKSGYSGYSGISGYSGYSGISGYSGYSGDLTNAVILAPANGTRNVIAPTGTNYPALTINANTSTSSGNILEIYDTTSSLAFKVDYQANTTFTNGLTCRYITLNHPSAPAINFTANGYSYLIGPVSGTGFSGYFFRNFTGTAEASVAFFLESSPASIGADQNNYALPLGCSYLRLTSSGAYNITGIAAPSFSSSTTGTGGYRLTLCNIGSNTLTLKHQSASSTATNRFIGRSAADFSLAADVTVDMIYDLTTGRWRII